jgi:hypothetical protein
MNLPKLSEELYGSARWLRVFACRRVSVDKRAIVRLAGLPASTVKSYLESGASLLSRP